MMAEVFGSVEALQAESVRAIVGQLADGVRENGAASLICSGGSTPGPVYQQLSNADGVDWSKVAIGLADERWAPPDSDASNEKLVRETLLQNAAAKASFHGMKTSASTAVEAVASVHADYAQMPRPLDVVVLGMGIDGHTLSWFPGADGIATAMDKDAEHLVAAVTAQKSIVTGDNLERMTLTAAAIKDARLVMLLITGDEKREVFELGAGYLPVRMLPGLCGDKLRVLWAP